MSATQRFLDALDNYQSVKQQNQGMRSTPPPSIDEAVSQVERALKAVIKEVNDETVRDMF
jgi:hypothetical protein